MVSAFVRRSVLLFAFVGCDLPAAEAQTSNATLHGTVTDTSGAVLPGVTVKLQVARDRPARATSSPTPPACTSSTSCPPAATRLPRSWRVSRRVRRADSAGSRSARTSGSISRWRSDRLDEIVNVEGTAPLLDRTSASIGTVIQASQLKELPLAGRHWAGLMLLAPGAINTGEGTHLSTRFVGPRARRQQLDVRRHRCDGRQGSAAGQRCAADHQQRIDRGIPRQFDAVLGRVRHGRRRRRAADLQDRHQPVSRHGLRLHPQRSRSTRGRSARSATCRRSR